MKLYRKRPVTVETEQWTGGNADVLKEFTGDLFRVLEPDPEGSRDPEITAEVYDWLHDTWVGVKTGQHIIKGVKGEFYPIDEDVLKGTYDAVGMSA